MGRLTGYRRIRRSAGSRRRASEAKKITILPKHVLFLLSFLCVAVMFVSYRFPAYVRPLKNAVDVFVTPMQKGINHLGLKVIEKRAEKKNIESLKEENAMLKKQLSQALEKSQITSQDKFELDALRELFVLDSKYSEYPKVAARIIARESNGWYNTFTVDKGSKDGILPDMNVIAGNGLVGIVTEVRKNSSIVRSVIDDESNVSGMFASGDTCIVSGDLNMIKSYGTLPVSMISMNAKIIENEEIVTSHISDKFLSGILIGYVKNVRTDASYMTKEADLVPAVNFEKLDEVLIITTVKDNED